MKILYTFLILIIMTYHYCLIAQNNIFEGKANISMGSNMTELQAIELAKIQVERDASEKAGIYIQSKTKIENHVLVENIVTTFSADVMKQIEFKYKKFLEKNHIVLSASGKYEVDMKAFNERLEHFKKEKELEKELISVKKRYNNLLNKIGKAENYETRKHLINEYKEFRNKSKSIHIGVELNLINNRITNLKDEIGFLLDKLELFMYENSEFYIENIDIKADMINIIINYVRRYDQNIENELAEILNFAYNKNVFKSLSFDEFHKFFIFANEPNLLLKCYSKDEELIYSKPVYLFSVNPDVIKNDKMYNVILRYCDGYKNKLLGIKSILRIDRGKNKCNISLKDIGGLSSLNKTGKLEISIENKSKISTIRLVRKDY